MATVQNDGEPIIEYKVRNADDSNYSTTKPTNAGLYTMRARVPEKLNYQALSATVDFEIEIAINDINYELDGGTFVEGYTAPITFLKNTSTTLPNKVILQNSDMFLQDGRH